MMIDVRSLKKDMAKLAFISARPQWHFLLDTVSKTSYLFLKILPCSQRAGEIYLFHLEGDDRKVSNQI